MFCWIMNRHYRLIAVDLSRQQQLDVDRKQFSKLNLLGNKKIRIVHMQMVLHDFRENQRNKIKNFPRKCNI